MRQMFSMSEERRAKCVVDFGKSFARNRLRGNVTHKTEMPYCYVEEVKNTPCRFKFDKLLKHVKKQSVTSQSSYVLIWTLQRMLDGLASFLDCKSQNDNMNMIWGNLPRLRTHPTMSPGKTLLERFDIAIWIVSLDCNAVNLNCTRQVPWTLHSIWIADEPFKPEKQMIAYFHSSKIRPWSTRTQDTK